MLMEHEWLQEARESMRKQRVRQAVLRAANRLNLNAGVE